MKTGDLVSFTSSMYRGWVLGIITRPDDRPGSHINGRPGHFYVFVDGKEFLIADCFMKVISEAR